jgi:hypothetical protein
VIALEQVMRVRDRFISPAILATEENHEFGGEETIMKSAFWKTPRDAARDGRRDHCPRTINHLIER